MRQIWLTHFRMMEEIANLRFKRAVVPEDAVSPNIETLDFGDASKSLICVAIYARFFAKWRILVTACSGKNRTIPREITLPRAELYASLVNSNTGEVVKWSFKEKFKSSIKLTDSQITLHWISNDEKPLKEWVRNRVIEICRFTSRQQWFYVQSGDMVADLGTRRGAALTDVDQYSTWINGFKWMHSTNLQQNFRSNQQLI